MHPLITETWIESRRADLIDEAERHRLGTPPGSPTGTPNWRVRAGRRLIRVGQRIAGEPAPAPTRQALVT